MAGVGVSWALAQTVDGALKLSREAALAATSDNVQPLALVACERFGGTLAVSSLARTKMEAMIRQQSRSPALKFLQAKIGYGKGGSLDALSKTSEGIRFLCVASALVSSGSNFDAGTALSEMISSTAEDKDMSPTAFQLKDVLDVLEPRINRFRFLDDPCGYQTLISQQVENVPSAIAVPCAAAIQAIVKSFREVSRIGEADAKSTSFVVGMFAPWLSSFARLCADIPPTISTADGQTIVDQQNSMVSIYVCEMSNTSIEIDITYEYTTSHKVIQDITQGEDTPAQATGMVSPQIHATLLLRELQFDRGVGARALQHALPPAIHLIPSAMPQPMITPVRWSTSDLSSQRSEFSQLPRSVQIVQLLPEEYVTETIMKAYLPECDAESLRKPLDAGLNITDLPLVRLWTQGRRSYVEVETEEEFLRRLSHVVADVLALSLVTPETVSDPAKLDFMALHIPQRELSPTLVSGSSWHKLVETILRDRKVEVHQSLRIDALLNWTLRLLGHEVSDQVEKRDWVASSFRGQVILPRVLFAHELPQCGVARLDIVPGTIMLESQKDRTFAWILSTANKYDRIDLSSQGLNSRTNLFPEAKVRWALSSKADHLNLDIGWTVNKNTQRPMHALLTLSSALMMGPCEHSPATPVIDPSSPTVLAPGSNKKMVGVTARGVALYPLYGNADLKLLALASIGWETTGLPERCPAVLINRGACINCLQSVAEMAHCLYIIL